jgi:hypothetical protein
MKKWEIYQDGERIEQAYAMPGMTKEQVKAHLVKHGFDESIELKEAK